MYREGKMKRLMRLYKIPCLIGVTFIAICIGAFIYFSMPGSLDDTKSEDALIQKDQGNDPQLKNNDNADISKAVEVKVATLKGSNKEYSNGIDVSKWQGKIDWSKVKKSGIDFAIIRVGYRTEGNGTIVEDPYAAYNLQKAKAHNIKIGVYFFSTAINQDEAVEEAIWTKNYIGKYPITYPVVYNCEGFSDADSRMHKLSQSKRTNNALAFLDTIKSAGYEGMLYASRGELENNNDWDTSTIASRYTIWVASYNGTYPSSKKPNYSGVCHMWQYTNKGVVDGISGNVDVNVAYFSYTKVAAAKQSGSITSANEAEVGMTFSETSGSVTAKEETNLRSEPSTSSSILTSITNGEYVEQTGKSDSGWTRVKYNGKTAYAYTQLLTTQTIEKVPEAEKGITFEKVNEIVTAKDETNLRSAPTTSGNVVTKLTNGQKVSRTGIGDNGWSRVKYDGKVCYAITSYLTTDLTPIKQEEVKQEETQTSGTQFDSTKDQVTAKEEVNLRSAPSTTNSSVVGTLKNGDYIERIGVSTNGWSRLQYNGQTVYAITSYLTN